MSGMKKFVALFLFVVAAGAAGAESYASLGDVVVVTACIATGERTVLEAVINSALTNDQKYVEALTANETNSLMHLEEGCAVVIIGKKGVASVTGRILPIYAILILDGPYRGETGWIATPMVTATIRPSKE